MNNIMDIINNSILCLTLYFSLTTLRASSLIPILLMPSYHKDAKDPERVPKETSLYSDQSSKIRKSLGNPNNTRNVLSGQDGL